MAAPSRAPAANYQLDEGDIVCVRLGQLGRQGVVGKDQAGWLLGAGCLRIRPTADVDPRYLTYQLGTTAALDWLGPSCHRFGHPRYQCTRAR